jgi:hypothetical protein
MVWVVQIWVVQIWIVWIRAGGCWRGQGMQRDYLQSSILEESDRARVGSG